MTKKKNSYADQKNPGWWIVATRHCTGGIVVVAAKILDYAKSQYAYRRKPLVMSWSGSLPTIRLEGRLVER